MRSSSILKQPSYKSITYGFKSLHYQGPMLWNKLPNDLKCAQNIYNFKRLLQNWNYNCICGKCLYVQCKNCDTFLPQQKL